MKDGLRQCFARRQRHGEIEHCKRVCVAWHEEVLSASANREHRRRVIEIVLLNDDRAIGCPIGRTERVTIPEIEAGPTDEKEVWTITDFRARVQSERWLARTSSELDRIAQRFARRWNRHIVIKHRILDQPCERKLRCKLTRRAARQYLYRNRICSVVVSH